MNLKTICLLVLGTLCFYASAQQKQVMVLSTLHGLHKTNPNYSYEDVIAVVNAFDPEVIGVEIRPEEINADREDVKGLYPHEMCMLLDSFPGKVYGIDYFGREMMGRLMSRDIFTDSTTEVGNFLQLQRKMDSDTLLQQQRAAMGLDSLMEQQMAIASLATANQMMDGRYDSVSRIYYQRLEQLLSGTRYENFLAFNDARDREITSNALKLIERADAERVLVVVGANHRARLVQALKSENVQLVDYIDLPKALAKMKTPINKKAPVVQRQEIVIKAPAERVWQVLSDIEDWPQWQSEITEAKLEGGLAEGSVFKWKAGGLSFTSQLHTVQADTALGWTGKTFGASAVHNWWIIPQDESTLVKVEESLQGFFPSLMKGKFNRDLEKGMRKSLEELKAEAEKELVVKRQEP